MNQIICGEKSYLFSDAITRQSAKTRKKKEEEKRRRKIVGRGRKTEEEERKKGQEEESTPAIMALTKTSISDSMQVCQIIDRFPIRSCASNCLVKIVVVQLPGIYLMFLPCLWEHDN